MKYFCELCSRRIKKKELSYCVLCRAKLLLSQRSHKLKTKKTMEEEKEEISEEETEEE